MLKQIKQALLGKEYKCSRCGATFTIAQSDKFVKTILPTCPVCKSNKVQVK